MRVSLIVAADERDTIGRDGALPWHLPEDLKRFRSLTTGHVVVAGRATQESIVARLGRPLPDRVTVVVTRATGHTDTSDVRFRANLDEALDTARALCAGGEVFIIGGAQVYADALPHVSRVHLTRVHDIVAGDRSMPDGWLDGFVEVDRDARDGFTFLTYERG